MNFGRWIVKSLGIFWESKEEWNLALNGMRIVSGVNVNGTRVRMI